MINLLRDILSPQKAKELTADQTESSAKLSNFMTWITIYGSDEAIEQFHNSMQAAYHSAPSTVLLRLYGEFVLAARRDMGYSDTGVQLSRILGMKINDLYDQEEFLKMTTVPFEEVCSTAGWLPPWSATRKPL